MTKRFSSVVFTALAFFGWSSTWSQSIKSEVVQNFKADTDIVFPLTAAFAPDSKWLAFGKGKDKLMLVELAKSKEAPLEIATDANAYLSACAFTPDGGTLLLGFKSGAIKYFDIKTRTFTKTVTAHEKAVCDLVFSNDGRTFYSGSKDNTIKSWTATGELVKTFEAAGGAWSLRLLDNKLFYNNQKGSKCLRAIDLTSGAEVEFPSSLCNRTDVNQAGVAAVGQYANVVQLVNTQENVAIELKGHKGWVNDVTFNPAGNLLASTSGDKMIFLWDLDNANTIAHKIDIGEKGLTSAFSPDGKWLATQTSFTVVLTSLSVPENTQRTVKEYNNGQYIGGLKNGLRHTSPGDSSIFLFKDGAKFVGNFKYDRMSEGDLYKPDGTKTFYKMKLRDVSSDVAFVLTNDNTNGFGGRTVETYLYFVRIEGAPTDVTDKELIAIAQRVKELMLEKNKQTASEDAIIFNRSYPFSEFMKFTQAARGLPGSSLNDQVNFEDYFYNAGLGIPK